MSTIKFLNYYTQTSCTNTVTFKQIEFTYIPYRENRLEAVDIYINAFN
jgi:hypothetical protein